MADPFHREAQLDLQSIHYPLGFPLHLKTNCAPIRAIAEDLWRAPKLFDKPPIELRVIVDPGGELPTPPAYRCQAHLMSAISDSDTFGIADYTRNFAYCRLSEAAARSRDFVSFYYLKALVNFSLAQLYLTPVHAACVALDGRGLLLCGASGAGKTTLAYACAKKGWTYISDNESWLVRGQNLLVGDPRRIRFNADAVQLFPELRDRPIQFRNGKPSIEMVPDAATSDMCAIDRVVFLSQPVDMLEEIPLYEPHVREAHRLSLDQLPESVELRSRDLDQAERELRGLLA